MWPSHIGYKLHFRRFCYEPLSMHFGRSDLKAQHVQMVLKCADIGHLAADPKTHKRWAYQLEEEFFRQVRRLYLANCPFAL